MSSFILRRKVFKFPTHARDEETLSSGTRRFLPAHDTSRHLIAPTTNISFNAQVASYERQITMRLHPEKKKGRQRFRTKPQLFHTFC